MSIDPALYERPANIYNRDAPGLPLPYEIGGPGADPDTFRAQIQAVLDSCATTERAFVEGVAEGTLERDVVAAWARELCIYVHVLGTLDGVVAKAGEWLGFDLVIRLGQPMALNFGYWDGGLPFAEQLVPLARALGLTEEILLPGSQPGLVLQGYLRVRESMGHGGLEVALASTFPESEWSRLSPVLCRGLTDHYGIPEAAVDILARLPELDQVRAEDRMNILGDIARSRAQQRAVLRATKESLSTWSFLWDSWADPPCSVRSARATDRIAGEDGTKEAR